MNKQPGKVVFPGEDGRVDGQVIPDRATDAAETWNDALEIAIRQYGRFLYRVAYSVLRNHHDAEDAVQEGFVRALRNRNRLEDVRNCRNWLARIIWRVALDRKKQPAATRTEEIGDAVEQLQSNLANTEEVFVGEEMMKLLDALIAALPGKLREPLVLATVEELASGDIAEILGIKEAAVRSRLFRARQMLRERLNKLIEAKHGI